MENIRSLEPKSVFNFFADISQIPHGSYNTKEISDFLVDFAKARGLRYVQDETTNVVIYKDATPGYENAPTVMLQGHIDMVCEKVDGSDKDMAKEGLDLALDGDWLYAVDTTLGGDDGAAVASMMALLDAEDLPHPALECIFTTDEETGLEGAEALDVSLLKGKMMINLDSEDEGILTVSCAGGITAETTLPIQREAACGKAYHITLDQLLGGHSGVEIDKEHANANILMGRILDLLHREQPLHLVDIAGGSVDNVICKRCEARVVVEDEIPEESIVRLQEMISHEYHSSDPDIRLTFEEETLAADARMLDAPSTSRVLSYLLMTPYGVQNMSADIAGLVETSLNLGALALQEEAMTALYAIRSSVKTRQDYVCHQLSAVAEALGGTVEYRFYYPAWEYLADSPLRETCIDVFREQYGYEPKVEAIHAGLECGIFAGKLGASFDAVSIGPDIKDVHTPKEKLSISSTQRFWTYLCGILKALKNV